MTLFIRTAKPLPVMPALPTILIHLRLTPLMLWVELSMVRQRTLILPWQEVITPRLSSQTSLPQPILMRLRILVVTPLILVPKQYMAGEHFTGTWTSLQLIFQPVQMPIIPQAGVKVRDKTRL